jgi:hypothetical protein
VPRLPNPKTKDTISFKARSVFDQEKIISFKKLAIQDEIELSDLFFEAVELLFLKHKMVIGGNPNRQLLSFSPDAPLVYPKCKCGKASAKHGLHLASKREYDFCKKCFSNIVGRYDVKLWSWKEETSKK